MLISSFLPGGVTARFNSSLQSIIGAHSAFPMLSVFSQSSVVVAVVVVVLGSQEIGDRHLEKKFQINNLKFIS